MSIETSFDDKKKSKTTNLWSFGGFFLGDCANFNIKKASLPENTSMYVNQGYKTIKDSKKCYYNDLYIIAQIMPLAEQSKDVESYDCEEDDMKILRALYDRETGKFWGIEQSIAQITVCDDAEEQFFDYGFDGENEITRLYCQTKHKIPNSFKSTCFGFLKNQFECGLLAEKQSSDVFFYLPSTVDWCKTINKYMKSVHLKPTVVNINELGGKDFNPASSFDRVMVVSFMKKVAAVSSQNLLRNADAFLSKSKQSNETFIWPKGKRTVSNKFALTKLKKFIFYLKMFIVKLSIIITVANKKSSFMKLLFLILIKNGKSYRNRKG